MLRSVNFIKSRTLYKGPSLGIELGLQVINFVKVAQAVRLVLAAQLSRIKRAQQHDVWRAAIVLTEIQPGRGPQPLDKMYSILHSMRCS